MHRYVDLLATVLEEDTAILANPDRERLLVNGLKKPMPDL